MGNPCGNRKVVVAAKHAEPNPDFSHRNRFQKKLKNRPTPAEHFTIRFLTRRACHFATQKMIHLYYVDFYFRTRKLILELDGGYHDAGYDFIRDHRIKKATEGKYSIVRIKNHDVTTERLTQLLESFPEQPVDEQLENRIRRRNPKGWHKEALRKQKVRL